MAHEVVIPLQRKFWYVQIKKREPLFSEVVLLRRRKKKRILEKGKFKGKSKYSSE